MKTFFVCLIFHVTFGNLVAEEGPDSVGVEEHSNLDIKLFRSINELNGSGIGSVLVLSDRSIYPVSILTPPALFTISRMNNNYYDENTSVLLFTSTVLNVGITHAVKNIVKRERPYNSIGGVKLQGLDNHDRYSFPSGHTSTAFNLATTLTLRYPDKPVLITSLYLYASLVGFGRMYFGAHYPSDVMVGALVGAGSSVLVYSLRKDIISFKNNLLGEGGRPDRNEFNSLTGYLTFGSIAVSEIINYFTQSGNENRKKNFLISPYPGGMSFTLQM